MQRILFVCTGNTCRSPMAEAILKSKNLDGVEVRSAGVFAADGSNASANSIQVMNENQLKHDHQSKLLTQEDVDWSSLILTMTLSHKAAILQKYSNAAGKVSTLKEFVGEGQSFDVSDPFGGSAEIYRTTYRELEKLIEAAASKLKP